MNSTISILEHYRHLQYHNMEPIIEPTAIMDIGSTRYDSAGAALFMIVCILWYCIGTVCMLGIQIPARAETIEDSARRRTKFFIQTLRDQTQTKQILEELADKQKRDKLWKIYLGKTNNNKYKLKNAEIHRIKNIEKQLAVINRNRMIMNDIVITPVVNNCIRRTSFDSQIKLIPNRLSTENPLRNRRRSSLDQQIIQGWKSIVDRSKAQEQLPWAIRKLIIRRHFRQYYKKSLNEFKQIDTSTTDFSFNHENLEFTDDEQCHLLPTHKPIADNSYEIKRKTNVRLNPYVTYFHLPAYENIKRNIHDLPLVTMKSDHHIIQMNHDENQC